MKEVNNKEFDATMTEYFKEIKEISDKYKVVQRLVVRFPHRPYGRGSLFCRLLLKYLAYRGGMLDIEYHIKNK